MKDPVELRDLRSGVLRVMFDFEKREVFLRNEPKLKQALVKKLYPCFPISSAWPIQQHNRHNARFAGLHKREDLERFIHRAKAAGKQRERVRLFHETQLARKEIIQRD